MNNKRKLIETDFESQNSNTINKKIKYDRKRKCNFDTENIECNNKKQKIICNEISIPIAEVEIFQKYLVYLEERVNNLENISSHQLNEINILRLENENLRSYYTDNQKNNQNFIF